MSAPKRKKYSNNPYDKWRESFDIDITEIVDFYRALPQVSTTKIPGGTADITYGVLNINDFDKIPLFATGDILYSDTTGSRDHRFPDTVEKQMKLMGQYETDDRGHLLARSLGGSNEPLNVVPMARQLNRHLALVSENKALGIPRSYWRANEDKILKFLRDNRNGRVAWTLALRYRDVTIICPERYDVYRPTVVAMQYSTYFDRNDEASLKHHGPVITYYNDNDFACGFEAFEDHSGDESFDDSDIGEDDCIVPVHDDSNK